MGLWRVLSDLEEEGYRTEWGLFSAEETGAPHQRIRCFILARLGNSPSLRPRGGRENCEGEQSEVLGERLESDGELAHTAGDYVEGRDLRQGEVQSRGSGTQPEELAHPASREPRQSQARNGGQDTSGGSEDTQWPARPGEEQYDWEEPRVVGDPKIKGCRGLVHEQGKSRDKKRGHADRSSNREEHPRQTQSELGGTTNGTTGGVDPIANRVDRIRLLGNGVVSKCAEIAWRTLWKEITND